MAVPFVFYDQSIKKTTHPISVSGIVIRQLYGFSRFFWLDDSLFCYELS
jgi:hypothetical protein